MTSTSALLEGRGLSKVYEVGSVRVHALRSVDVSLLSRELVVLLGVSGSGKSALSNIFGGLDRPSSGTLEEPPAG